MLAVSFVIALTLAQDSGVEFRPLDANLTDYAYPFPTETFDFTAQGEEARMVYMDVPAPQPNGKTVVLLHGKNFSGNYWERTIRHLADNGYRVIAPDQIGFGKSSKPLGFQYSFHALAEFTQALLVSKNVENYHLVGHSMGGMLATRLALLYPESVEKLVLVNPIGLEDYRSLVPYRSVDQLYEQELKANEQSIREYQKNAYFAGEWQRAYDKQIEILVGWTLHDDFPTTAYTAALTSDMVYTQPVVHEFKNLTMPTLLLIGTRDRTAIGKDRVDPEAQEELGRYDRLGKLTQQAIKGSKLVEWPDVGHMPQVENFDAYAKELTAFLDD